MPSKCKTEGCDKQAKGGGYRYQTEGCDKLDQGGGRCKAHGGGRRRKVGSPSIQEAPKGLSEDEKHDVDLVEGEGKDEVVPHPGPLRVVRGDRTVWCIDWSKVYDCERRSNSGKFSLYSRMGLESQRWRRHYS